MDILVVVDMQNDFVSGALGSPQAKILVPKIARKVAKARKNGYKIIFTQDTHYSDYLETIEGKKLPVPHCIFDTHGWEIVNGIRVKDDDMVVRKTTFGCYLLPELILNEVQDNIDSITIVGLCTDICVISNAMILKSSFYDIPIIVDSKCCAGTSRENHETALKAMKQCHIDVI